MELLLREMTGLLLGGVLVSLRGGGPLPLPLPLPPSWLLDGGLHDGNTQLHKRLAQEDYSHGRLAAILRHIL